MLRIFDLLAGDGLIFFIFVLGVLAFPYSPDLRRVLAHIPLVQAFTKSSDAKGYILLRRAYNNSYQLIVLILGYSIKALIRGVAFSVAVLLLYDLGKFFSLEIVESTKAIMVTVAVALLCPFLGLIQWIFWTRKLLFDLDGYHQEQRKAARETAKSV
jgi:hypothetical protein